jgi:hypothetical protein
LAVSILLPDFIELLLVIVKNMVRCSRHQKRFVLLLLQPVVGHFVQNGQLN